MSHWFKFYGQDYLTDPKMMSLRLDEKAYWLTLLCLASNTPDGVIRHITEEQVKMFSGVSPSDTEGDASRPLFDTFVNLNLIRILPDGVEVTNFKKRQETNLTDAERSARYRLKKTERDENHGHDVTKVTLEENRIEEKRVEKKDMLTMFAEFWSHYPRKESRKKAEQTFLKIAPNETTFKEIIAGLEKAKKSSQWVKDGGQFIPHPTTWLNQERWKDEGVKTLFPTGGVSDKFKGVSKKI